MNYTTKAGKEVIINFAGFEDADDLKSQVELELLQVNINIGDLFSCKNINSETINTVKNAIALLDSSKDIKRLVFKCLERSLYNGLKINQDTFKNDMDAIAEYNTIKINCIRTQLQPFFQNQLSELMELFGKVKEILKQSKEVDQAQD